MLISGGGPVGLTLAIALSRLGIRSMVVNDRLNTTTHPKLDVVNCRSMEIYRQLGLAETIRENGNPLDANQYSAFAASASGPFYAVMSTRHLIYQPVAQARETISKTNDGSLPLESMQRIAQMYLEPVLLDAAKADPMIDLRFGFRLYGFEQDAEGVTARAQHIQNEDSLSGPLPVSDRLRWAGQHGAELPQHRLRRHAGPDRRTLYHPFPLTRNRTHSIRIGSRTGIRGFGAQDSPDCWSRRMRAGTILSCIDCLRRAPENRLRKSSTKPSAAS